MPFTFTIQKRDGKARTALFKTPHGIIHTPAFCPVATKATVKTLSSHDLEEIGAEILMCNTYHLYLKPGTKTMKRMGGLHQFMNWKKPIITDSGGFQAFSLGMGIEHGIGKFDNIFPDEPNLDGSRGKRQGKQAQPGRSMTVITDQGIEFRSIYDSSKHFLTPKGSLQIQKDLGSDLTLVLDECTSPLSDYNYTKNSMERTHRWAKEQIKYKNKQQFMFGIIQGGYFEDLRKESARVISSLPFDGIAIGGSLGKTKADMHKILEWALPFLPENKPRHLLGIGTVEDIFESVKRGIDLFDCVGPTRIARAGYAYIRPESGGRKNNKYRIHVTNGSFRHDKKPLDTNCTCKMCKTYTRAYVYHLFKSREMLASRIVSYHNVYFFLKLMEEIRQAINRKRFSQLCKKWIR